MPRKTKLENNLSYDALHGFTLVWLRNGSNKADINRFEAILDHNTLKKRGPRRPK